MADKVCVGEFTGAHGVRGAVKLRSFTVEPADVAAYGPLTDAAGRQFDVTLIGTVKDAFLARVEGVSDRDQADALRGVRVFIDRDRLPQAEDEAFYHADLIGLRAVRMDGVALGTVRAVHDFGAGDVLEIVAADGRAELLPFTRAVVPVVDVAGGKVVVDPPFAVEAAPGTERDEP